jgi:signal transduction histidine kinase
MSDRERKPQQQAPSAAAAAAVRAAEQRFRDFAEASSDWLWEQDAELRFSFLAAGSSGPEAAAQAYVLGKRWADTGIEAIDAAAGAQNAADIAARRPFRNFRVRRRRIDGSWLHLSISGKPVFDAEGRFAGYRGTSTDITVMVEAQAELDRTSRVLRGTFDNVTHGILVYDGNLRLVDFNQRVLQVRELPADKLKIGMTFAEVFAVFVEDSGLSPAAKAEDLRQRLARMRRAQPFLEERKRGAMTYEVRGNPLPDGGWVITQTDVTERKQIEQELREAKEHAEFASRAKSEFLANMSHELRTPLNAVLGFTELMIGKVFGPLGHVKYQEYAQYIHDSGAHLLGVINDILDLSKIEAGKRELQEEVLDANLLARAALRIVEGRAADGELRLRVELPDQPLFIHADSRAVKQILLNLLSNAVKFTPVGGSVTLSCGLDPAGGIFYTVADTGIGMAPEHIVTALEAFGQIESSLGRRFEGTGLGLPLVQSLIGLHDGRLVLESELGKGTRAVVHFPPARSVRQAAQAVG